MPRVPVMQAIVEILASEGVDTAFGCPGAAILPLYQALEAHGGIKHLVVRHEEGATHMADGWARTTGNVGVAIGTSGPAGTNMITGLYTAQADSIPMAEESCRTASITVSRPDRRPRSDGPTAWPLTKRKGSGGIGALLRREGLYSSLLATWRRERDAGVLQALAPHKRGPKSKHDPVTEENQRLRRETARLTEELRKAEIVIDIQKKVATLLGRPILAADPEEKP